MGKNKLFNILKAYASVDPLVGYAQGTNYIAFLILLNIEDEESAFWCFFQIMNGHSHWREIVIKDTPKLIKLLH
jgi:hypothetical protein